MSRSERPMPPPLHIAKPGLWRRTPPAIFPPIMGLMGLGLTWRAASEETGITNAPGDFILGLVTLLFLFSLLAYMTKVARRAGVLVEDLRILPGRAGLAAASLSLMLLAAALSPLAPSLAGPVALLAFALHLGLVGLLIRVLYLSPPEGRTVTPVFHLNFVGFILLGLTANDLGRHDLSTILLVVMIVPAIVIWAISLRQLQSRIPPAPLRPLLAIHLAPASLFTIIAHGAGLPGVALLFCVLACAIFLALLVSVRWLTQSGFSPLWGAFTFPVAAFATALFKVFGTTPAGGMLAALLLVAATVFIPVITWRVFRLWANGTLAMKTNAAEA